MGLSQTPKNQFRGAGKIAYSIKCLLCKLEDLSLSLSTHVRKMGAGWDNGSVGQVLAVKVKTLLSTHGKKLGAMARVCNTGPGRVEAGRCQGFAGQSA